MRREIERASLHVHWCEYLKSIKGAQNKTGDDTLLARPAMTSESLSVL
jgi:hypothetical protein